MAGGATEFAVNRGNDWALAEVLDGIGCSSFPQWAGIDDADFGMRIDMVRSAAGKKKLWLSELQGGRAAVGFEIFGKVHASRQQRWLWNGLASGADTLLIWCWRDEDHRQSVGEARRSLRSLSPRSRSGGDPLFSAELFSRLGAGGECRQNARCVDRIRKGTDPQLRAMPVSGGDPDGMFPGV